MRTACTSSSPPASWPRSPRSAAWPSPPPGWCGRCATSASRSPSCCPTTAASAGGDDVVTPLDVPAVGRAGRRPTGRHRRRRPHHPGPGPGQRPPPPLPQPDGIGLARQRPAVPRLLRRRGRAGRARAARRPPPQRLAHLGRAGLPVPPSADRAHDPQPGLPRADQPGLAATASPTSGRPSTATATATRSSAASGWPTRSSPSARPTPGRSSPTDGHGHRRRAAGPRRPARRHPQRDRHDGLGPGPRPAPARALRLAATSSGKAACRATCSREMGLPDLGGPLVVMVSRLVEQKGVDLAPAAARPRSIGCPRRSPAG